MNKSFSPFLLLVISVICLHSAKLVAQSLSSIELNGVALSSELPLFEHVPEDVSGIHFENRYDHPERWRTLWHQYFLGTIGTGVALGDVNGDELPDIYAVGKDSPNALYVNTGNFRFEDATSTAGVEGKEGIGAGVSMLDIDNDGDLDIYVTYTGFENELYINNGKGVFSEQAEAWGLNIATGSNAPSFGDYDLDGDLDLYLQCNFLVESGLPEGMPDLFFENIGTRFVEKTKEAGINGNGQGHAAIWWDYNEDGWPDVYVANDFEPADKLYRNNHDGTFTNVIGDVLISSPYSAMGADIGDINNDGHIDFIVAEMAARDHGKHHRTVGSISTKLLRAPTSTVSQYMKNMLSVKVGPNQFSEISYLSNMHATDWTWAARLSDLDNDGLQDAFFTNGMARAFHDGDIGLKAARARTGWQRMAHYKASPQYDEKNIAYRNEGDFQFSDVSKEWGLDLLGVSFSAAFADFDNDGDLDIVVSNMEENLTLYRNRSSKGNRLIVRLIGEESNRYGIGAKIKIVVNGEKQIRELSLTRGYLSSDEPVAHFGLGKSDQIDLLQIEWPSGTVQSYKDLEVNRKYIIRENNEETVNEAEGVRNTVFRKSNIVIPKNTITREEYFQLFPMQMLIPEVETRKGPPLAVSDLDNDGWKDVVLGGPTGLETRVYRNLEGRSLELVESDAFEDDYDSEDRSISIFDYEEDGDFDLLVSSGSIELSDGDEYYEDRVYVNQGNLEFNRLEKSSFAPSRHSSNTTLIGDFDNDGGIDFLISGGTKRGAYPLHENNYLFSGVEGEYALNTKSALSELFKKSGNVTDMLYVDLDGDGDKDIVQVEKWGIPRLWYNEDGEWTELTDGFSGAALEGVWSSVAAGDLDGDGRVDLVLGNIGKNVAYRPSVNEPVVLYAPGNKYIENTYIEAYTINGELYPIENRMLHDIQFPELMDRTSRSVAEYSEQRIQDIFPEDLLSQYEVFKMTEGRSLVLFQKEAGTFTPQPLPHWAQSGSVNDIIVADVNGDGSQDIILSQEMRAPALWADRSLRGHLSLLLNDGAGSFKSLLPWDSGLEVNGYPRDLAWADMDNDGKNELIVSMNEGPLLIFEQN